MLFSWRRSHRCVSLLQVVTLEWTHWSNSVEDFMIQSRTGWHFRRRLKKTCTIKTVNSLVSHRDSDAKPGGLFVPRLLFTSAPLFLLLTWLPRCRLCAPFVPERVVFYMATMEGERCDLSLSLRTLISQSSWLHKSFLMFDKGDNRELHSLFTVQHHRSFGVGSPPALLLLTCLVLTRTATIKHWKRNKGRVDQRVASWRENTTRFQQPLWNQLQRLCPAALGSPLLVPFSGWLGWGLHQNPTGAAGTNPICCQIPLFL